MVTWPETIAERFWEAAGGPEPFPRRLEDGIALALPVMVVRLPRLGLFGAERWICQHNERFPGIGQRGAPTVDRPLRACLVAVAGSGCILLDGSDPPDEQRYSLAHEVAHFLLDYEAPRERVVRHLGGPALAVLDGHRPATAEERVDAVLAGVPLGPHLHMLERGPRGIERGAIAAAEARADDLALELLAPRASARALLPERGRRAERIECGAVALAAAFALPPVQAHSYARRLIEERDGPPSWQEWLA